MTRIPPEMIASQMIDSRSTSTSVPARSARMRTTAPTTPIASRLNWSKMP